MSQKMNKNHLKLAIKSQNSSGERSYERNKQALADFKCKKTKFDRPRSSGTVSLLASCRACGYNRGLLIIRFDHDMGFVRCDDTPLYSQYFSDNHTTSIITRLIKQKRLTNVLSLLENQGYTGDAAILMIAHVQFGGEAW